MIFLIISKTTLLPPVAAPSPMPKVDLLTLKSLLQNQQATYWLVVQRPPMSDLKLLYQIKVNSYDSPLRVKWNRYLFNFDILLIIEGNNSNTRGCNRSPWSTRIICYRFSLSYFFKYIYMTKCNIITISIL